MYFEPKTHSFRPLAENRRHPTVAIVGGGPVGLALALGLARRDCTVVVFEADDSACHGSRAICISRHSLEALDRIGLGHRFLATGLAWSKGRSYYRDTEVLAFEMPRSDGDVFPPMINISQSQAEELLIDAAEDADGVSVQWQSRVVGCTQDASTVRLDVQTPEGRLSCEADWVVAADGARSSMRELLGLRMTGSSYEGRYVIADIHWPSDLPAERRVWFDPPSAPGSTLILHRQPDDIWRVDYQLGRDDDLEIEVREDRVRARISRHLTWLGESTPWTLEWVSLYRAHALSLERYRHGRVLFAGDAAHLVPIFGVRGLNSGLEDVDTLSWMLPLVARGDAEERLLDVWAAERRDAWQQNIAQADLSTRFMTPGTIGYQRTRDAVLALAPVRPELRDLINPRQTSATHARRSPLSDQGRPAAGTLAPGDPIVDIPTDPSCAADTGPTSLFGLAAGRFIVLGHDIPAEELAGISQQVASRFGGPDHVVTLSAEMLDSAAADEVLGGPAKESFVIRPDGLVLARVPAGQRLSAISLATARVDRAPSQTEEPDVAVGTRSRQLEQIWRLLSEAIDDLPDEQPEAALTRLLLALALGHCTPAQVRDAIELAATAA